MGTICLLLLWPCLAAPSSPSYRTTDQFYHKAWTAKDGAPGEISSLAQTSDGYLWLGTRTGIYRFDGVRFEKYRLGGGQSLLKEHVSELIADPNGGLWISYFLGGLTFLKDGHAVHYGERDGLAINTIFSLAIDHQGSVWAASTNKALMRLEGGRWRTFGTDWDFLLNPHDLQVDGAGTLWVNTRAKVFFLRARSMKFEEWTRQDAGAFAEANAGVVLRLRPAGKRGEAPAVERFMRDLEGGLWSAEMAGGVRHAGVRHTRPETLDNSDARGQQAPDQFTQKDGLTGDKTYAMIRDSEGSIWVSTNLGLDQFRAGTIVPVRLPDSFSSFALAPRDQGGIWATADFSSTQGSLLEIRANGVASVRPVRGVISAFRDPAGAVWIGTRVRKVLRWYRGAMQAISVDASAVAGITMDPLGRLWALLQGKGYSRLEQGQWTTNIARLGAPAHGHLTSFTDSMGRVWFGCLRNRVVLLEHDKASVLTDKEGVGVGDVTTIRGRGGSVWIGGEHGLELFDGNRFVPMLPANWPEFTGITGIVETADDGLWIGESRGILHIPNDELRQFKKNPRYRVASRIFDTLDGLPAPLQGPWPAPSATEDQDGRIWFATQKGVVWIDPKRLAGSGAPPHVMVHSLAVNGQTHVSGPRPIRLPAHTTDLQIGYTATSLAIPERVRFRYRLEGQDETWKDAGTRREAFYTNLGPGTYRFHVIACNSEGVWDETGAYLNFAIAPAFYQTWWCQLSYVALGSGVLWLFYRYRLKLATARIQQRLGARMEERERIARELHDTLLQGFQGLMLRLQAVMRTLPADAPAHQMMEKVLDRADGVLLEGRQSVRDLREEGATGNELGEALASIGEELSQSNSTSFRLAVLGSPKPLSPIVFHDVRRIAREALINAFQHAQAAKIEVELGYTADGVSMRIRDDGTGIDPAILQKGKAGHWGLSGMRERAQKIGARLSIWSSSGAGTEMELAIPAVVAYPADDTRGSSLWTRITGRIR